MSGMHYTPPSVSAANYALQLSFDQARLIRHHRHLAANGIDPSGESSDWFQWFHPITFSSGMPLDAKAVTRL